MTPHPYDTVPPTVHPENREPAKPGCDNCEEPGASVLIIARVGTFKIEVPLITLCDHCEDAIASRDWETLRECRSGDRLDSDQERQARYDEYEREDERRAFEAGAMSVDLEQDTEPGRCKDCGQFGMTKNLYYYERPRRLCEGCLAARVP